jgi:hypothetical protein
LDLNQCLKERFEDCSVEHDILSVRLDHSKFRFAIPILQVVPKDCFESVNVDEFALLRILDEKTFSNAFQSFHMPSQSFENFFDDFNLHSVSLKLLLQSDNNLLFLLFVFTHKRLDESWNASNFDLELVSNLSI